MKKKKIKLAKNVWCHNNVTQTFVTQSRYTRVQQNYRNVQIHVQWQDINSLKIFFKN